MDSARWRQIYVEIMETWYIMIYELPSNPTKNEFISEILIPKLIHSYDEYNNTVEANEEWYRWRYQEWYRDVMNTTNTFEDKYNEEDAKLDGTSSKVKENSVGGRSWTESRYVYHIITKYKI